MTAFIKRHHEAVLCTLVIATAMLSVTRTPFALLGVWAAIAAVAVLCLEPLGGRRLPLSDHRLRTIAKIALVSTLVLIVAVMALHGTALIWTGVGLLVAAILVMQASLFSLRSL